MSYCYHVGRDLSLVTDDEDGMEVEGACRLPPGRVVRLTGVTGAGTAGRPAMVTAWRVIRLSRGGPVYRGYCEWIRGRHDSATR